MMFEQSALVLKNLKSLYAIPYTMRSAHQSAHIALQEIKDTTFSLYKMYRILLDKQFKERKQFIGDQMEHNSLLRAFALTSISRWGDVSLIWPSCHSLCGKRTRLSGSGTRWRLRFNFQFAGLTQNG
jgi:hypothetical protein